MIKFLTNIISTFFKSEDDRKRLYRTVIPSFIVHFFAGILALVFVFVMTRGLGSKEYGVFTYSYSVISVMVNLATFGICVMVVKENSSLLSTGKTSYGKGLYKWSFKITVLLCIGFALIAAIFIVLSTYFLHLFKETVYSIPLLLALISVPLLGIMNYYSASLRGQHKIVLSLLPDNIVKPLIFLLLAGILFVFSFNLSIWISIWLYTIASGGGALFAMIAFYKMNQFKNIVAEYDLELWKKSLKSFFLLYVLLSINSRIDILMLRYLKDSSQVGIYSVADMIAAKLVLFLQIMNLITSASISRLHILKQKQKLQEMMTKVSRWVFIISLPVFIIIILFSKWIMSYFGPGFESGQTALIIIAVGQIINIACGPAGNFALMTGNQLSVIIFTAITIFINITLNLILTPAMGINGTAIATALSLLAGNTAMFLTLRKKTGIRTWILG